MNEMMLEDKLMKLVIEVKKDMDAYDIPYDKKATFSINGRLSRALGRCIYLRNENRTRIEIQKKYLEFGETQEIKDTICHELIHSYKDCWNCGHTGLWKELANLMTYRSHGVYTITRLTCASNQYHENVKKDYKYKVKCCGCKNEFGFNSKTKFIKSLVDLDDCNYSIGYSCSKCGSHKFIVYGNH